MKINKNLIQDKHTLIHTDNGTSIFHSSEDQFETMQIYPKNYGIKIEESASDTIIQSCMPFVQGSCLFSKIIEALDFLEDR